MTAINIKLYRMIGLGCVALLISGCISLPNIQSSPNPRFYMLSPINETQVSKKIDITPGVIIGVGPVKLPEYLDRPQMVTRDKEGTLKFDEFDRWGESLDLGIARLIREDLTVMLPSANLTLYPWNPSTPVKYQVIVEVIQINSELDRDMHFIVQWSVIDAQTAKAVIIKRSEFHQAIFPQNYVGLVKTLSTACASLSSQIAEALGTIK